VALTTNQNYVRDFAVAYDILYENISDQVAPRRPSLPAPGSRGFSSRSVLVWSLPWLAPRQRECWSGIKAGE